MKKALKIATLSLVLNLLFCIYHVVLGIVSGSFWLLTLGIYYYVLSTTRFTIIRVKKNERFLARFTGWMLLILSLPLVGTVILSLLEKRGHRLHEILMITVATYAFTKITLATVNLIKSRNTLSQKMATLRSVSFADALVSIFSLQRSMLVTFEGMSDQEALIMNAVLGFSVCVVIFIIGLNLIKTKMFPSDYTSTKFENQPTLHDKKSNCT